MRMTRLIVAAALGCGVSWSHAAQQESGAAFLKITPSPRSYALGTSNVVSALGAQAIGANPANMGLTSQRFEAFTSYASMMGGMQYQHLAASYSPAQTLGVDSFGISMTRLQVAGLDEADASGAKTGASFGAGDMALGLSAAGRVGQSLRLGVTAKAIQSEIGGYKSNMALAADVGLTYTLSRFAKPVSIGASVTNLGQGVKFIDQTDPLPTSANVGVALPFGPAVAMFEINRMLLEQSTQIGTGLEFGLGAVSFRAGFLARNDSGNLALQDQSGPARILGGLSGGVGVKMGMLRFDYAVSQQAVEFGPTQRLALTLQWGGASGRKAKTDDWKADPDRSDWLLRSMGSY